MTVVLNLNGLRARNCKPVTLIDADSRGSFLDCSQQGDREGQKRPFEREHPSALGDGQ